MYPTRQRWCCCIAVYISKDHCQIFIFVSSCQNFIFLFFTCLDYSVSVSSIGTPYTGCLCRRFPPTSAWRTADKRAMSSSSSSSRPRLDRHQQSEEGMFRSSLPDEPRDAFWVDLQQHQKSAPTCDECEMSPGCQISFLVFGWSQNRPNLFLSRRESRLTCLDPEVESSRVHLGSSRGPKPDALLSVFSLLLILTQGGLFILGRLGCTFVFYMNLLKIKFFPLMREWLWFTTGTKINDDKRERNVIFRFKSCFISLHWPNKLTLSKNRTNGLQWLGILHCKSLVSQQRRQFLFTSSLTFSMLIRCGIGCAHCMPVLKRHRVCAASNIRIVPSDAKPHQINADWVSLPARDLHCGSRGFSASCFSSIFSTALPYL